MVYSLKYKLIKIAMMVPILLALAAFVGNGPAKAWGGPGTCQVSSEITSNFNGTAIPAGDSIWFSSVIKVHGLPSNQAATITFEDQTINFTANGKTYNNGTVPIGQVQFDANATSATTAAPDTTPGDNWLTTVPPNVSGNTFLSGFTFVVPAGGLSGGINPVTWSGLFDLPTNVSVTVNWQWAAAVYTSFSEYDQLGVKPVDDNQLSQYKNSDHAGTPENYQSYVVGGARGGGGANYTGSYSATASARCP